MKLVTAFYIINATLLLLHEIESAYEREWEILKLPGKITGFLLMHIPIILIMFYRLLEIDKLSAPGMILGGILGLGGICPLLLHKILVRRKEKFNLLISNAIIYLNAACGASLVCLLASRYFG